MKHLLTTLAFVLAFDPASAEYFAKVENGIVTRVIVITPEKLATGRWGNPANWIQTNLTGRARKNYAGRGYTYNPTLDAFVPPKPFPSWRLNTETATWEAPVPYPRDGSVHIWNESSRRWIKRN